jgi:hypothetical protein
MSAEKPGQEQYEPPEVEQIPTDSGPAVTAAGDTQQPDNPVGVEWLPSVPPDED